MFEMVAPPTEGRTFAGTRRVRLGDCSPGGRLRLDAVARYLQDLSDDDTRDTGLPQMTWVVRRSVIDVDRFPTYLEQVDMVTWCSAIGSRWAERRVDVASASGGSISAATLWVHLDPDSLRPTSPATGFDDFFSASAGGRSVSSKLSLRPPPPDLDPRPWALRFTDFDVMDHVNNSIAFVVIEEVLARRRDLRAPLRIEVEYRSAIDRDVALSAGGLDGPPSDDGDAELHSGWLIDDRSRCHVAFRITRPPSGGESARPSAVPPSAVLRGGSR